MQSMGLVVLPQTCVQVCHHDPMHLSRQKIHICACKQTSTKQSPKVLNTTDNNQIWQQPTLSMMPYLTASYGSKYFGLLMVFSISSGSWSVCSPSNLTCQPQVTIKQISNQTKKPSDVQSRLASGCLHNLWPMFLLAQLQKANRNVQLVPCKHVRRCFFKLYEFLDSCVGK